MRHDYNLPGNWHSPNPEEKNEWYHQERERRQVLQQDTPYINSVIQESKRLSRRAKARSETTEVQR